VVADALVYGYTHHPALLSFRRPGRPSLLLCSAVEEFEEPARPDHLCPQGLGSSPKLAISGDEGDRLAGCSSDHVDERLIAIAPGMHHRDAVSETGGRALTRPAFEDHNDGLIDPSGGSGGAHTGDECPCGSRSVPPPPGWARSDDVRCVDEKHASSTDVGVQAPQGVFRSRLVHEPELLVLVRESLGIVEQDSRLGSFSLVKRRLILLLLVVEIGLAVEGSDVCGILGIQRIRLFDLGDVVRGFRHLSPHIVCIGGHAAHRRGPGLNGPIAVAGICEL
jgi:hypothetical protein